MKLVLIGKSVRKDKKFRFFSEYSDYFKKNADLKKKVIFLKCNVFSTRNSGVVRKIKDFSLDQFPEPERLKDQTHNLKS